MRFEGGAGPARRLVRVLSSSVRATPPPPFVGFSGLGSGLRRAGEAMGQGSFLLGYGVHDNLHFAGFCARSVHFDYVFGISVANLAAHLSSGDLRS